MSVYDGKLQVDSFLNFFAEKNILTSNNVLAGLKNCSLFRLHNNIQHLLGQFKSLIHPLKGSIFKNSGKTEFQKKEIWSLCITKRRKAELSKIQAINNIPISKTTKQKPFGIFTLLQKIQKKFRP